jgi:hypothetical protein
LSNEIDKLLQVHTRASFLLKQSLSLIVIQQSMALSTVFNLIYEGEKMSNQLGIKIQEMLINILIFINPKPIIAG